MTTPTTQPDDRCEQIARDVLNRANMAPAGWHFLQHVIAAALQAAKQQGREEVIKNSIDLLGRGCERHVEIIRKQSFAEFRENYPVCQWCLAEEVRKFQQQPKSDPSRECVEIARGIADNLLLNHRHEIWGAIGKGGRETVKARDLIANAVVFTLWAKQDELNALREEVLGVIEPFATWATAFSEAVSSAEKLYLCSDVHLGHCRAALALRDKLVHAAHNSVENTVDKL